MRRSETSWGLFDAAEGRTSGPPSDVSKRSGEVGMAFDILNERWLSIPLPDDSRLKDWGKESRWLNCRSESTKFSGFPDSFASYWSDSLLIFCNLMSWLKAPSGSLVSSACVPNQLKEIRMQQYKCQGKMKMWFWGENHLKTDCYTEFHFCGNTVLYLSLLLFHDE